MNKQFEHINPLIINNLFKVLNRISIEAGISDIEQRFNNKYNNAQQGDYPFLTYNKREKSYTFESYNNGVWFQDTENFNNYLSEYIKEKVGYIKKIYSEILNDKSNTQIQLIEYDELFNSLLLRLFKEIENISNNTYKTILIEQCNVLKNRNVVPYLESLNSKKTKVIKEKDIKVPNSFVSDSFDDRVTTVLRNGLIKNKIIEHCTETEFNKFFSNKGLIKPSSKKLIWIGTIGMCRYFINQIETEFNIKKLVDIKWLILNKCITIKGKPNYDFNKVGSDGKYGSVDDRKTISEIVKKAKDI